MSPGKAGRYVVGRPPVRLISFRDQFAGFHSLPFAAFLTPSIMTTLV